MPVSDALQVKGGLCPERRAEEHHIRHIRQQQGFAAGTVAVAHYLAAGIGVHVADQHRAERADGCFHVLPVDPGGDLAAHLEAAPAGVEHAGQAVLRVVPAAVEHGKGRLHHGQNDARNNIQSHPDGHLSHARQHHAPHTEHGAGDHAHDEKHQEVRDEDRDGEGKDQLARPVLTYLVPAVYRHKQHQHGRVHQHEQIVAPAVKGGVCIKA